MLSPEIKLFVIPLAVMVVTQIIKSIIDWQRGEFNWNLLLNYGGMPSGHTSLVVSTATVIGLYQGFLTPLFLLAALIALLIIRDAIGFRSQLSEHAKILNQLIKELPDDKEFKYPYSPERLGHTPLQVMAGVAVGIILTLIFYYLL